MRRETRICRVLQCSKCQLLHVFSLFKKYVQLALIFLHQAGGQEKQMNKITNNNCRLSLSSAHLIALSKQNTKIKNNKIDLYMAIQELPLKTCKSIIRFACFGQNKTKTKLNKYVESKWSDLIETILMKDLAHLPRNTIETEANHELPCLDVQAAKYYKL